MSKINPEERSYRVDKITFLVTPVYRETQGETIFTILLNLMKSEFECS